MQFLEGEEERKKNFVGWLGPLGLGERALHMAWPLQGCSGRYCSITFSITKTKIEADLLVVKIIKLACF